MNDEKRPVHISEYTGAKNMKEILEGHGSWCKSELLTKTGCTFWNGEWVVIWQKSSQRKTGATTILNDNQIRHFLVIFM